MTDPALQAQVDAATAYEEFFVPALFSEWPARVVQALGLQKEHRVLDVACGTGVLTRELAGRIGPGGRVAGLDINEGMLTLARRSLPEVEFRQGTAEALPYPDATFDAVTCQFGLMFFADRAQALREMLRVLVPGGRVVATVWDSLDNIPAYAAEVELLQRLAGERAAEALRAPFVLGNRRALARLFENAGVISVTIATHTGTARFPSIRAVVEADLRGWLPIWGVTLGEEKILEILTEADRAMRSCVTRNGGITFESPAHLVSGTKAQ
jgi:SAM-dependent methyltransferase